MRTRCDDRLLEANHFLLASFFLAGAGSELDLQVIGIQKLADATHDVDLAHFGHADQARRELVDDFFLVFAQPIELDVLLAEDDSMLFHLPDFVGHGGDMQQCFGRDATHIQAHTAQLRVALDDDGFHAEIGSAESGGIAAGTCAQYDHFAGHIDGTGVGVSCDRCRVGSQCGCGFRGGCFRRPRQCWSLGWWARGFLGCRNGSFCVKHQDYRTHRDLVAELDLDFLHDAGVRGGHFHRRLVALQRDQRVFLLDRIADLDQDFDNGDIGKITDIGDFNFDQIRLRVVHSEPLTVPACGCRTSARPGRLRSARRQRHRRRDGHRKGTSAG